MPETPVRPDPGLAPHVVAEIRTVAGLAALLRHLRRREARQQGARSLTYRELAAKTGWSRGILGEYFTGRVLPPTDRFDVLIGLLGATLDEQGRLATARDRIEEARRTGELPSNAASSRIPHQLPSAVSGFVGRAVELAELDRLVSDTSTGDSALRIGLISGMAGIGKTALAVHWAHRVYGQFPHGQLYVNLRGYTTAAEPMRPIDVLSRFLRALGLPPGQVPMDLDEAADLYRTLLAGKRVLVVLDNAREVGQVRSLLPGSPGCLVLVTSRDRLAGLVASEGARLVEVEGLRREEARRLFIWTIGEDRVLAEPEATDELTEACARLPLALRIAAADLVNDQRGRIAGYVARLRADGQLTVLAAGDDERTAIRGAFDVSYQVIPAAARRVFRLLGLVPGPEVTADVAAAMAEIDTADAARLLDRLASAHLVDSPVTGRYTCHDLLRRYAAELAVGSESESERRAAVDRMLQCYLRTADAAAQTLYPEKLRLGVPAEIGPAPATFVDPAAALAWLDAERSNLVAAVKFVAEQGPAAMTWLLADVLRGYFYLRMHMADWAVVAQAGLTAAECAGDLRGQAAARISLADLDWRHGRHLTAIDHYVQALAVTRQIGWVRGQATILSNLGTVYWQAGQLDRSADHFSEALALNQRSGWLAGQARNLINIATVAWQRGQLAESVEIFNKALVIDRKIESRGGEAVTLNNLGETYHLMGRLGDAVDSLEQALRIHHEIGDRGTQSETLRCLAAVHLDAGRFDVAAELARTALKLAIETGNHRHETEALITLAAVDLRVGEPHQAIDGLVRALELARDSYYRYGQTAALLGLATAYGRLRRAAKAVASAQQALGMATKGGYQLLAGQAATVLAAVQLGRDQINAAVDHAREALTLHERTGHRIGAAQAHAILAEALARRDDDEAAARHRILADELFRDIGIPPWQPGS